MPKSAQTVAVATPCCPAPVSAIIRFLQQDENDAIGMDEWNLLNGLSGTIVLEAKKLRNPKMRKMHIDQLYKNVVKGNKKVV